MFLVCHGVGPSHVSRALMFVGCFRTYRYKRSSPFKKRPLKGFPDSIFQLQVSVCPFGVWDVERLSSLSMSRVSMSPHAQAHELTTHQVFGSPTSSLKRELGGHSDGETRSEDAQRGFEISITCLRRWVFDHGSKYPVRG